MSTLFDFKSWCETNGLKKDTTNLLTEQDLNTNKKPFVLITLHRVDVTTLEFMMTLGQRKLRILPQAIATLRKDYPNETQIDMAGRLFQNCLLT